MGPTEEEALGPCFQLGLATSTASPW